MYLALYRKYRPQTFDDVISQEHITVTLKNQLKSGQTAHAYMFTGSRGTGKTTCAKILAKAINCLRPVDGNPCLECESCRAIEEGAADVTEIDAASNNGVDNVRELKEEAMYAPISCRCRVYIIDEVHMLSPSAFNALLKLIEEPPAHVVFIFATTEIHKVPATILSRCQRFEFRRIDINDSKKRLLEIAAKENMQLDGNAAYLISRVSDGGMRDALSLLDQCFSVSSRVTEETVRDCAGISGTEHLFGIADAAAAHDARTALTILRGLTERSKSPVRLIEELISHYRTLMLLKAGADVRSLRITESEAEGFLKQNERYTLEMLMRALSILGEALAGMSRTRNEELLCEMCLIRLCTPKLDVDEAALSGRIDALEKLVNDALTRQADRAPAEASYAAAPEKPIINEPPIPEEEPDIPPPEPSAPVEMPLSMPFGMDEPPADAFPAETLPEPPSLSEALGLPAREAAVTDVIPEPEAIPPAPEPPEPRKISAPPGEIPEEAEIAGYEPFPEWKTIIESLPFSVRILIDGTTAMINGNTVLVSGSGLQKGYATGEFSETIREAVSRAIGRKVMITARPDSAPGKGAGPNKLKEFLDLARDKGVTVKEEN